MTRKSTKRSLIMCVLSMALCLAMLIGSTYAWFSDKATTGTVTITAGNLKVDIVKTDDQHTSLKGSSLFDSDSLEWEPGKMYVSEPFQIKNIGNLALKFDLKGTLTNTAETGTPDITERLKYKIVALPDSGDVADAYKALTDAKDTGATLAQRQALWTAAGDETTITKNIILPNGKTVTEEATQSVEYSEKFIVILFWEPDGSTEPGEEHNEDNKFNMIGTNKDKELKATFTLDVEATQAPFESDAFGTDYDKTASLPLGTPEA